MRVSLLALALAASLPAHAAGLADLASKLDSISTTCSEMAMEAQSAGRSERLDADLAQSSERQRIRNEVEIYSIGHGRRQTDMHMLQLMQESARKQSEEAAARAEVSVERSRQVSECVAGALENGKQAHRESRGSKPLPAAVDLVSAWIANTETISVQNPHGSEEPRAVWRREKARAELD